jgi:hypothetical protein
MGQTEFGEHLFLSNRSGTIMCAENGLYICPMILVEYETVLVGPVQLDELTTYEDVSGNYWEFPHLVLPRLGRFRNGIQAAGLRAVTEYTSMAPYHEFAKTYDAATTWYREHISSNDPANMVQVFGTCQSSRDIVNRLFRFMEKDRKNYLAIKNEILTMRTFIMNIKPRSISSSRTRRSSTNWLPHIRPN